MSESKRKIILVTTTRADWGILSPLARALMQQPDISLTIAAGNMHLLDQYGKTIDDIRSEGFDNIAILDMPKAISNSAQSRTEIAAAITKSMGRLINSQKPQAIIILGDRYEMLGAAAAALIGSVPIVHLHGGEVTYGAIDDAVRNAISMMATLHLPATRLSAERLVNLGAPTDKVVVTGSIGVYNTLSIPPVSAAQLSSHLGGFDISPDHTLLVTFHPVTRHPEGLSTATQIDNLLNAIADVPGCNAIITYPNNDTDSEVIITRLENFTKAHPDRVKLVKSLGKVMYISAMSHVRAVVGNSSSGLLEAPSTPAETINIGPRQSGRECATSVIHVPDSREDIADAIRRLITTPRSRQRPLEHNPYYAPFPVQTAVKAIMTLVKPNEQP